MGRYADVDYLLKNNAVKMDWSDQKWVSEFSLVSAINLNVAPIVHGHWIDMENFEQCSVCKATHLKGFNSLYGKVTWIRTAYCPHCGAKMDEKIDL